MKTVDFPMRMCENWKGIWEFGESSQSGEIKFLEMGPCFVFL